MLLQKGVPLSARSPLEGHSEKGGVVVITLYLSPGSLAAARAVDPRVTPAAVHAAVEVAIAEQLRAVAGLSADQIRARAEQIERRGE
ncbi:MAG: hypothetical protein ACRDTC_24740 [Pseudonocardiaceae bacterium]